MLSKTQQIYSKVLRKAYTFTTDTDLFLNYHKTKYYLFFLMYESRRVSHINSDSSFVTSKMVLYIIHTQLPNFHNSLQEGVR